MKPEKNLQNIINECQNSRAFRHALGFESHEWFFSLYLNHHADSPFSWFHGEMFKRSEKEGHNLSVIMAFRGAGKSTIMNLSLAIWSILGKLRKKLVVIISKERSQAKFHLENIIQELKDNELLKNDFDNINPKIKSGNIIELPEYQAKIVISHSFKSLRGFKNGKHRPDLIICDDIEDLKSITKERNRKELFDWFTREVVSIGGENTHIVVLGNSLHLDSLLMNLYKGIENKKIDGSFFAYPLLDDNNKILWPEKYNEKLVRDLKNNCLNQESWLNDYLLVQTRGLCMSDLIDILENKSPNSFLKLQDQQLKKHSSQEYKISVPGLINFWVDDPEMLKNKKDKLDNGYNANDETIIELNKILSKSSENKLN